MREASLFWNRLSDAAPTVSDGNWFHRLVFIRYHVKMNGDTVGLPIAQVFLCIISGLVNLPVACLIYTALIIKERLLCASVCYVPITCTCFLLPVSGDTHNLLVLLPILHLEY